MRNLFQNLLKKVKVLFKKKDLAAEMVKNFSQLLISGGTSIEEVTRNASKKAADQDNTSKELFDQGQALFEKADAEYQKAVEILKRERDRQIEISNDKTSEAKYLANEAKLTRKAIAAINIQKE